MNLILLKPLTKVLSVVVGLLLLVRAPAADPEGWDNDLPDGTRLAFNVIADVHMETTNPHAKNVTAKIFRNMAAHSNYKDALFMLGDNTMNGKYSENLFLYGLLANTKPAKRYVTVCDEDTGETWEHTGLGMQVAVTDREVILEGVNFYRSALDEDRVVVPIR